MGSRDVVRIENGYSLYGHEIDETIDPFEANLGWTIALDKYFLGKVALLEKKNDCGRKLKGFILNDKVIVRHGL